MTVDASLVELAGLAGRDLLASSITRFVEQHGLRTKAAARDVNATTRQLVGSLNEGALALGVREALRWSSSIHVQGMVEPISTETASVSLDFAPVARRFRTVGAMTGHFDEDELLRSSESYLILGDPGSGKTTTLKRLILALSSASEDEDASESALPVLLVCREIDWSTTTFVDETLGRLGLDPSTVHRALGAADDAVLGLAAAALDAVHAVVLVDGVDEIPESTHRSRLETSLERVQRLSDHARLLCSSRLGEIPHLDGFLVADLLPLSNGQVRDIASRRTHAADEFLAAVNAAGIAELADRPLFLNQLLTVYETTGAIAERPAELYRQLVRLLLHEWDEQRRVKRHSSYANFDNSAKQDFLAEIAFRLSEQGQVTFSDADLVEVYRSIAPAFGLPKNEAQQVVSEIESHVGIVSAIRDGFQFTHLTLQEYLCAECIVRQGMNDEVAAFMRRYPQAMAVAVALSSRPNHWLAECARRSRQFDTYKDVAAFGRRLGRERPRFLANDELGETVLALLSRSSGEDAANWEQLLSMQAVKESLDLTRKAFRFRSQGEYVSYARPENEDDRRRRRISVGRIPRPIYDLAFAS